VVSARSRYHHPFRLSKPRICANRLTLTPLRTYTMSRSTPG
jgi:hypothetical protein